jgi:RhtB (resistance to homoserine/threonine) family protein
MEALSSAYAVAVISLLAAISPGPDFCIVLKNSLSHSRKAGLLTALGVSLALIFHLTYTLLGIGVFITQSPVVYTLIKCSGAIYLVYIGFSSLRSSFKSAVSLDQNQFTPLAHLSASKAVMQGFLTNLLNPKAAVFFISLFSQFIDASTPLALMVEYAFINWSIALGWFLFLSYLVTSEGFIKKIHYFRAYIDRVMGGALLLLGMKLLFV